MKTRPTLSPRSPTTLIIVASALFIVTGSLAFVFAKTSLAQIDATSPTETVQAPDEASILELNDQIAERRKKIDELNRQAQAFEQTAQQKEKEALTLSTELSTIDDQIQDTSLRLDSTRTEIEATELEIRVLEKQIQEKQSQIEEQTDNLGAVLRQLYKQRQRSMLEVLVVEQTFGDFVASVQRLTQLQNDVRSGLDELTALQHDLQISQDDLLGRRAQLLQTRERLDLLNKSYNEQKDYKTGILTQTQSSQAKFESLLNNIRSESDSVNAEISTLEQRVREKLGSEQGSQQGKLGTGPLAWPVDPGRGISAYFHDPTYPFRCTANNQRNCIGEHPAVDIRVPQGTPISAAADGYVAIARRLDWVRDDQGQIIRPAYNYVTIIHGDGISTVYGHLSSVKVVEDTYVTKGQVIGLTGALPGTAGAGVWTTGPHLHFEVRKDGIPQDPLNYLP